jgi:hypothetical protein
MNTEDCVALKQQLERQQAQMSTWGSSGDKTKFYAIRNLPGDYDCMQLREDMELLGIPVIRVHPARRGSYYLAVIKETPEWSLEEMKDLRYIGNSRVQVDK